MAWADRPDPPSKTALFEGAKAWDAAAVKAMLAAAPALVRAPDPKHRTALHLACAVKPGGSGLGEPNGIKTVTTLLDAGAGLEAEVPIEEVDEVFRATPVWFAVARGENLPLARFLLKRGADASHSLWAAVWRDDAALCRELLKNKPRLDLKAHGETPIFYAARLQRLKTLDLLIEAGANPCIADPRGRDAVDIARARRLPKDVIAKLEDLKRSQPAGNGNGPRSTSMRMLTEPTRRCHYCLFDTAIGQVGVAWSGRGLTRLQLPEAERSATERRLRGRSVSTAAGRPPPPMRAGDRRHAEIHGRRGNRFHPAQSGPRRASAPSTAASTSPAAHRLGRDHHLRRTGAASRSSRRRARRRPGHGAQSRARHHPVPSRARQRQTRPAAFPPSAAPTPSSGCWRWKACASAVRCRCCLGCLAPALMRRRCPALTRH